MKRKLTPARLREALNYNPDTGIFTWKISKKGVIRKENAGCLDKQSNYLSITIDGLKNRCHRLAWLYIYSEFPVGMIDHIDRNRTNNRILNLRIVNFSKNSMNTSIRSDNTSGYRGVSWCNLTKKWAAYIWKDKKKIHIGLFDNIEDAAAAHKRASLELFGEYSSFYGKTGY
jgi:hypothetical protein